MDEHTQRAAILDSRRRRAERVKEYERDKAVIEDGQPENQRSDEASQKDADRSSKAAG